jgi:hypothetical protein
MTNFKLIPKRIVLTSRDIKFQGDLISKYVFNQIGQYVPDHLKAEVNVPCINAVDPLCSTTSFPQAPASLSLFKQED